jgi:hypothetical protein
MSVTSNPGRQGAEEDKGNKWQGGVKAGSFPVSKNKFQPGFSRAKVCDAVCKP